MARSTGAALGYRDGFPADRPCFRSTMSPPIAAATSTASSTIRRAARVRPLARLAGLPVAGAATRCGTTLISTGPASVTAIVTPASHQLTRLPPPGVSRMASSAASAPAATAMTTLARRTSQPSWCSAAPRARISVNSAARRCATSRAPSSTTTAPMTARLTYSSPSTGATALSAATNGARIAGTCELTVTVTGGSWSYRSSSGTLARPSPRWWFRRWRSPAPRSPGR